MYTFKKEMKEQLLDGRTITYLAKKIDYSKEHLISVLNGTTPCSIKLARTICRYYHNIPIEYNVDDELILEFFNKN